jgi:hypothetical protein
MILVHFGLQNTGRLYAYMRIDIGSRDSAVGITTDYGLDDQGVGVRVPVGARISTSPCRPYPVLGPTQPPIQCVRGAFTLGVKRPKREADHSPATSAEVKNTWIYMSTSPYTFMA